MNEGHSEGPEKFVTDEEFVAAWRRYFVEGNKTSEDNALIEEWEEEHSGYETDSEEELAALLLQSRLTAEAGDYHSPGPFLHVALHKAQQLGHNELVQEIQKTIAENEARKSKSELDPTIVKNFETALQSVFASVPTQVSPADWNVRRTPFSECGGAYMSVSRHLALGATSPEYSLLISRSHTLGGATDVSFTVRGSNVSKSKSAAEADFNVNITDQEGVSYTVSNDASDPTNEQLKGLTKLLNSISKTP